MAIPQLKQQLRLRGLKVTGRKSELLERLGQAMEQEEQDEFFRAMKKNKDKKKKGTTSSPPRDFIDVTPYLEDDEKEDVVRTVKLGPNLDDDDDDEAEGNNANKPSKDPEVWGADAKIVDDYEGRTPVVDNLSRCRVQFTGSNGTPIEAFVVASRDALKGYLSSGSTTTATPPEERLQEIQRAREEENRKTPVFEPDPTIKDHDDEQGHYENVAFRDYDDWGSQCNRGSVVFSGSTRSLAAQRCLRSNQQ